MSVLNFKDFFNFDPEKTKSENGKINFFSKFGDLTFSMNVEKSEFYQNELSDVVDYFYLSDEVKGTSALFSINDVSIIIYVHNNKMSINFFNIELNLDMYLKKEFKEKLEKVLNSITEFNYLKLDLDGKKIFSIPEKKLNFKNEIKFLSSLYKLDDFSEKVKNYFEEELEEHDFYQSVSILEEDFNFISGNYLFIYEFYKSIYEVLEKDSKVDYSFLNKIKNKYKYLENII